MPPKHRKTKRKGKAGRRGGRPDTTRPETRLELCEQSRRQRRGRARTRGPVSDR